MNIFLQERKYIEIDLGTYLLSKFTAFCTNSKADLTDGKLLFYPLILLFISTISFDQISRSIRNEH